MLHTPPPTHQEGGSTNYNLSEKMNSEVTPNDKSTKQGLEKAG